MAGIDTRILVTNSDGMGRYLAIRTYADRLTITDESTNQMMTIALTTSVAGANTGDQTAATVPLSPTWGLDAGNVQDAALELSGSIGAIANAPIVVRTAEPLLANAVVLSELPTGILANTGGTGALSIAGSEDFPVLNQDTTGNAATATTAGSAATADKLTAARTINGVAFDGTANITIEDITKSPLAGPGSSQAFTVGSFGCNGKTPQGSYAVNAACTDLATAVALINQLRTALIATGIAV